VLLGMSHNSDFLRSLKLLYLKCLRETAAGLRLNVHQYGLHIILLLVFCAIERVVGGIGGIAGSLIRGFLTSAYMAIYFITVIAAVEQERLSWVEALRRSTRLLGPFFGLLFIFFLVSFVIQTVLRDPNQAILASLVIAVCWNAVLERSSQTEESPQSSLLGSWIVFKENTIEWLPAFLLTVIVTSVLNSPDDWYRNFVLELSIHPLQLFQISLTLASVGGVLLFTHLQGWALVLLLYPCFIFRGVLYRHLAKSNRRKRIFEAKF